MNIRTETQPTIPNIFAVYLLTLWQLSHNSSVWLNFFLIHLCFFVKECGGKRRDDKTSRTIPSPLSSSSPRLMKTRPRLPRVLSVCRWSTPNMRSDRTLASSCTETSGQWFIMKQYTAAAVSSSLQLRLCVRPPPGLLRRRRREVQTGSWTNTPSYRPRPWWISPPFEQQPC